MSYDSTVLADSPDGYWPLDDAGGSGSVRDASGNGHAGTPSNVTLGSTGYANDGSTAASFNGSSSFITLPFPVVSAAPVTFEFIIKPSSTTPVGIYDSAPSQTNVLRQYSSGNVEWWSGDPSVALSLPDTNAHHLALVYENASSHRRITYYLDGVQKTQTSGSTTTTVGWVNPMRLGDINSGGAGRYNGTLQKFALWKSALTSTQIYNHYLAFLAGSTNDDRVSRNDVEFAYTPNTSFTPVPPPLASFTRQHFAVLADEPEDEFIFDRRRVIVAASNLPPGLAAFAIRARAQRLTFDEEVEAWLDELPAFTRWRLQALLASASSGGTTVPNFKPVLIVTNSN